MQNEKLVTGILNILKTALHPLQIEQIQAALPEFKHLTDEDWYRQAKEGEFDMDHTQRTHQA